MASVVALLLLLVPPGYLMAEVLSLNQERDLLARVALWSSLSVAVVPLMLLWLTVAGVQVTPGLVRVALTGAAVVALWRGLVHKRDRLAWSLHLTTPWRSQVAALVPGSQQWRYLAATADVSAPTVAVLAVLLLTAVLRFYPVAALVLPSWVDPVHHTIIARLVVEQGGVPDTYQPLLPVSPFAYHFGFHALSAVFVWLTGADPAYAVLAVGQTLNFLAAAGAYWAAQRLTGSKWAGVLGALVVGTLSVMPAHFVNWGRYTHLAGMTLLSATVALLARRGQRGVPWRTALAVAVILAGLIVIHYRVLIFALAFVAVSAGVGLWSRAVGYRHLVALFSSCLIALLLASPWLYRLGRLAFSDRGVWSGVAVDASYNALPHELLLVSVSRPVAIAAAWGWLLALWRRDRPVVAVGLWVPVLFAMANSQVMGFRASPLITNSSVLISLYLPSALLTAYFGSALVSALEKHIRGHGQAYYPHVVATAIVVLALAGTRARWPVITPETVLADDEDLSALTWIRGNTPADAKFLISAWRWQANIYVGTDAGYWIPALTGRQTTVPPALYVQGTPEYVARVNTLADVTARGPEVDAPRFRELLKREGVTHAFIGARGSMLSAPAFLESRHYALVYASGNVWIFEVLREGDSSAILAQGAQKGSIR